MRNEQAHDIGMRMGRGRVPQYTRKDWEELYPGAERDTFTVYYQGYRNGRAMFLHKYSDGEFKVA